MRSCKQQRASAHSRVAGSRPHPCHAARPRGPQRSQAVATGAADMLVSEWLKYDQDPASRAAVEQLRDAGADKELQEMLGQRLEFGTAGLRGKMGPGFNRMNPVTVQQASQGLAAYLLQQAPDLARSKGVVIGHDARHHSAEYAAIAAAVFLSRSIPVSLFSGVVPTPYVAAGVGQLGAAAGVMVTASHNTKEYNGYKVYWGNGCQIIPPHDAGIAAAIEANLELWALPSLDDHPLLSDPTTSVTNTYFKAVAANLCYCGKEDNAAAPQVVYTPLHGVGLLPVQRAFSVFGLPRPLVVEAQAAPDPEFPTVSFPNPEEGKGTWQMAFDTATAAGTRLVLANDPDADRLAAAEQRPGAPGSFQTFSGNDIGLLLADWVWTNTRRRHPEVPPSHYAMLSSAVSSRALAAMAAAEGFVWRETLTGFKWLGNVASQLTAGQGLEVLFAFEEAIGFMFYATNKDKDGVAAAAVFAEMAASYYRSGSSVAQRLAQLYQKYGAHIYRAGYYIADPPSRSQGVFAALRQGGNYPADIGGVKVTGVRDLGTGVDTTTPDQQPTLPWTPGDMMVTFYTEQGGTLTLRASATEPKLKYYLEVAGGDAAVAEAVAGQLEGGIEALVQPQVYGLQPRPPS